MSSLLIGKVLCTAVFIIGVAIGLLAGFPGWCLGLVLMIGAPCLHVYGCHRAAEETRQQSKTTFDLISLTWNGAHPGTPESYQVPPDQRGHRCGDEQ